VTLLGVKARDPALKDEVACSLASPTSHLKLNFSKTLHFKPQKTNTDATIIVLSAQTNGK
jgi:hypothetical protein